MPALVDKRCYYCICRVCGSLRCPHVQMGMDTARKRKTLARCLGCQRLDNGPLLDCDYFKPKPIHTYKVIRRYRKRDELMKRLDNIERLLLEYIRGRN